MRDESVAGSMGGHFACPNLPSKAPYLIEFIGEFWQRPSGQYGIKVRLAAILCQSSRDDFLHSKAAIH